MLSDYIEIGKLLEVEKQYIRNCAKYAAVLYKGLGVKYEMFEGTSLELSPELCENIYKDLLSDIVKSNCLIGNKFGLTATIIPLQEVETKRVCFNVNLGVIFPNVSDEVRNEGKV
jgi:hypothetical protein